jgi:Tol biopolymer transport system component
MILLNISTQEETELLHSPASIGDISELMWSPSGDYIVYTERKYPDYKETSDLVLFNLDKNESKKITYTDGNEVHPTWSPSSNELAFVYEDEILDAVVPNDPEATENLKQLQYRKIFIMNRDGTERRQVFEFASRITSLAWSPNGQELVFASREKQCGSLYIVSIDGQNLRKLNTLGCSESPSWSPDGRYIVYVGRVDQNSYRWDGKWQIYVIEPVTGSIVQLTDNPSWIPFLPVWSN